MKTKKQKILLAAISIIVLISIIVGLVNANKKGQTEKKIDYSSYVTGIKNWTVEIDTKDPDFMKNVEWDSKYITKVTVDDSKVDTSKAGKYSITYSIDVKDPKEIGLKESKYVQVISKKQADTAIKNGDEVVTDDGIQNEDKEENNKSSLSEQKQSSNESKTNTTSTSSKNESTTSKGEAAKPSGSTGNSSSNNSSSSSTSKPSGSTGNSSSSNSGSTSSSNNSSSSSTSKPSHTHNWVEQFKTVHHDAVYETKYVVDTPAWDEQVPRYNSEVHNICNICGEDLTATNQSAASHGKVHALAGEGAGHHTEVVQTIVGYDTVHHDEVGHNEQVLVKEAYDEKVSTGYKCSCGATK